MMSPETMREWVAYAKSLTNEELSELITEFYKIQNNRADNKRRAAAKKVEEAIAEYFALGEKISVGGSIEIDGWGESDVSATLSCCDNDDGYLSFYFIEWKG